MRERPEREAKLFWASQAEHILRLPNLHWKFTMESWFATLPYFFFKTKLKFNITMEINKYIYINIATHVEHWGTFVNEILSFTKIILFSQVSTCLWS